MDGSRNDERLAHKVLRPDGFFRSRKALLVMDSMRAHITPQFKAKLKAVNTIPAIIPGGLTKILQPLDISVNRSFKAVFASPVGQWMMKEASFTALKARHCNFRKSRKETKERKETQQANPDASVASGTIAKASEMSMADIFRSSEN
ncbi:hypothetical protein WMY93_022908 [Mugilogobius chulae]|uniref:DDE-1 domain-containing protein n=1 Tax=Mugilogobius chulae TaxID=88201 RepID=A0AAW0N779_9GOBI